MGNKCDMFDELQVTEDEGRAKACKLPNVLRYTRIHRL